MSTTTDATKKKRATNIEEFGALFGALITQEGVGKGLALKLRPTDVVIAPFGKSGTTWLQQIVHTLRTRGDMDFDDISRVVPWIETSTDLGIDLDGEQKANPRAFKSHLAWDAVPKGGRYIVSLRDPKDAFYSGYKFMEGWFFEPGTISPEDFLETPLLSPNEYCAHLVSWWRHRDDANVLLLAYEHMKADLTGTIRRVADFIGIELDDELLAMTQEHASLDFMLAHKDRFDDSLMRTRSEKVCGLPPGSDSAKVRKGEVGGHKEKLSPEVLAKLDAIWQREVAEVIGFKDYASLIAEL